MSDDPVAKSVAETKVEYRRLGNSGLKVSVPILGAMSFGDSRWQPWVVNEDEVRSVGDKAFPIITQPGPASLEGRLRSRFKHLGHWYGYIVEVSKLHY